MSEITYYQRNKEKILNRAKDYNKNNKEKLRVSEKEKEIKKEYGRNRYKNV